jgi:hypothetical protein
MSYLELPEPPGKSEGIVLLIGGIVSAIVFVTVLGIGAVYGPLPGSACVSFPCFLSLMCLTLGTYTFLSYWTSLP